MDSRHVVLKLFVNELGEPGEITDFENRKIFQKAVYIGQLSGVDLGYRYSWYLRGPYSTQLARDYYQLADAMELGDREFENRSLNEHVRQKLRVIRDLFRVPDGWPRSKADWLELLASWHYLISVSRRDDAEARRIMQKEKPALAPYIDAANTALQRHNFVS
jgi:uncharacterized protein YwgA